MVCTDVVAEDVMRSASAAPTITQINGIDAATYVGDTIFAASFNQDADAAYNSMFYNKATDASGQGNGYFASGGRERYIYQGANTTFTFANGTTVGFENWAQIKGDWTGVVDGSSFYEMFCLPRGDGSAAFVPPKPKIVPSEFGISSVSGFPQPVIIDRDGVVAGYYMSGPGLDDVAVIALSGFESSSPAEFQSTAQKFFAMATAAGKTKLVVDLQANGGGYIFQGYDLFRMLFPDILQEGFSRWRENEGFLAVSHIFSDTVGAAGFDPRTSADFTLIDEWASPWNYRFDFNETNQPFATFDDKFAPHVVKGDAYTALMRWNLDDPLITTNETFGLGIEISGYGTRKNLTRPFPDAANIILVHDGACASTCTLFAEFMTAQAGVRSVVLGGRPSTAGKPMQGVGGVKGGQVLPFSAIADVAYTAHSSSGATDAQREVLARYDPLPAFRSTNAAVNVRDQVLRRQVEDGSGIPAQFVVEEADCRLWWTAEMVLDAAEVWRAAAGAAWGGKKCVGGAGFGENARRTPPPPSVVPRQSADDGKPRMAYPSKLNYLRAIP